MDLVLLVLVLCLVGFAVWLLTTKIPMPPFWAQTIQILALLALLVYVFRYVGGLPNVLP